MHEVREARFGFVRFITVVSRMYLRGMNPETYVYTKKCIKNNNDNGNGKKLCAFLFQLRFAHRQGEGDLLSTAQITAAGT
jgi:hypothetical protein